jgi:DNA-binding transcriptional LysR family regulator
LPTKIDLRKLPPLNSLKGFEAATRRQSVREAADELFLTHPAVSYQIQVLEQDLGVELFSRAGRSLAPTAEAASSTATLRRALETLIQGVSVACRARADSPLRVCRPTSPPQSAGWHALPDFVAAHPDIKVLLTTYAFDWAFDDTIADVGLVYCEKELGRNTTGLPCSTIACTRCAGRRSRDSSGRRRARPGCSSCRSWQSTVKRTTGTCGANRRSLCTEPSRQSWWTPSRSS